MSWPNYSQYTEDQKKLVRVDFIIKFGTLRLCYPHLSFQLPKGDESLEELYYRYELVYHACHGKEKLA
jgi:hypothetical protein